MALAVVTHVMAVTGAGKDVESVAKRVVRR